MSGNDYFFTNVSEKKVTLTCKNVWTLKNANQIYKALKAINVENKDIVFECQDILEFDTHGILCMLRYENLLREKNIKVIYTGMSERLEKLFQVCQKNYQSNVRTEDEEHFLGEFFYKIGDLVHKYKNTMIDFFSFVGGAFDSLKIIFHAPHKFRFKSTLYHIQTSGLQALPIIFLTSFLIGVVIAFQGAVQLEKFGANIFIVEMVSISVARELAPLLTAIVVAGRSASSYTAQIGVMKITEEIDAMETMGFNSWQFLVIPRIIGLMIALPLLVLFADAISIFGGMVVASTSLGISFTEFMLRMQESVELKHFFIGFAKAPIFGWIVAIIGCFRGFQISSSTQSVGKYTTISVVNAIFWVIAMDAIISVFLTEMGL